VRLLAVSDEIDAALESARTREAIGPIDLIVGCGDLEPTYLSFLADAFGVPMRYVRGNHDVGAAWSATRRAMTPEPLDDGRLVSEDGLRLVGFSGSPIYSQRGLERAQQQVGGGAMWWRVLTAWPRIARRRPVLILSHAAPRGLNDAPDPAHRGFSAFRWLLERAQPPLWLHGHTALVRRGVDARTVVHDGTLLVNVTGATVIELAPPEAA
jgi:Icc-related predicted phosphoesterase